MADITDIATLHAWMAVYWNSNSKKILEKLRKIFYRSKRGKMWYSYFPHIKVFANT